VKKSIFTLFLFFLVKISFAQTPQTVQNDTLPIYERFPNVPPFTIMTVPDSTAFSKDDLKKKKETIIMVFSPDCSHCQHETKELTEHMDMFKDVQIVMASPLDYHYILQFYKDYHIADYPNITMGRDGSYMLGTFYKITNFPSIFVYNKKGEFVKAFDGSYPIEKIAAAL
jgi:thioredoxin-related protein